MAVRLSPDHSRTIRDYREACDDQLMLLFQHDDAKAFQELIARHKGLIASQVYKFFGSHHDPDDIIQDISLSLWQNRQTWKPGVAKFSTWLHRIVTNRCIDLQRQNKNVMRKDMLDEDLPAGIATAEDVMASAQLSNRMLSLLGELPSQQMKALKLFYYEDAEIENICDNMNLSEQAVRSLLKRGKQKLRDLIPSQPAYI